MSESLNVVILSVPHAKDTHWLENDPTAEFSYNLHQLLKQEPPCLPDCLRCRLEKAAKLETGMVK